MQLLAFPTVREEEYAKFNEEVAKIAKECVRVRPFPQHPLSLVALIVPTHTGAAS